MLFRWVLLILILGTVGVIAGKAALVPGNDGVPLNFQQRDGTCDATGSFDVAADGSTAWDVLTDYDQMHHFVGSLKRSRLEVCSARGRFLLEQEFMGGFLFVAKRMRLRLAVQEIRCKSIFFEDVGHADFEFYRGSWELRSVPGKGSSVFYSLQAQQNLDEPFAGDYMKSSIQDLLDSVRLEILRRQALKISFSST